jgi:hypothetical protein
MPTANGRGELSRPPPPAPETALASRSSRPRGAPLRALRQGCFRLGHQIAGRSGYFSDLHPRAVRCTQERDDRLAKPVAGGGSRTAFARARLHPSSSGYVRLDAGNDRRRRTIARSLEGALVACLRDRPSRRGRSADHGPRPLRRQRVPADLPLAAAVLEDAGQRPFQERMAARARTRLAMSTGKPPP